jgi:hypothetical protein
MSAQEPDGMTIGPQWRRAPKVWRASCAPHRGSRRCRRLAAAGLVARDVHSDAGALEHADDGHADVRVDFVDQAGVKAGSAPILNALSIRRRAPFGEQPFDERDDFLFLLDVDFTGCFAGKPACALRTRPSRPR